MAALALLRLKPTVTSRRRWAVGLVSCSRSAAMVHRATSQQLCGRAKKPDLHDTMTRCTGQHANNHHTSTQRCVSRPTQLAQPPECGEKPSAKNVTGADTQPSPKGKCQRHKCQADHQSNTLCHLPLPVAMSSRKSRTKVSPCKGRLHQGHRGQESTWGPEPPCTVGGNSIEQQTRS